jgi:hypothetical protein
LCKKDDELSNGYADNDMIVDYTGAIFRLENIIKLMSAKYYTFSVQFVGNGYLRIGEKVKIRFTHLSYYGDTTFSCVIKKLSLGKNNNIVNITVMILDNNEMLSTTFDIMEENDYEITEVNGYDIIESN